MTSREPPKPLGVTPEIFDEMTGETPKVFCNKVRQHYICLFFGGGYEPIFGSNGPICNNDNMRLHDAWEAFCHDKEHVMDSLHSKSTDADCFKLSGILAYWLRRCAPVYGLRDLNLTYKSKNEHLVELLKKYPSEFPAFDIGLYICSAFQAQQKKAPVGVPAIDDNNFDYYKDICFLLKRKNLSPHSLGMIYRSLFVPLRPKQEIELAEPESDEYFSSKDLKFS